MKKTKDTNLIHDMANGLKSQKNQNKVKKYLEDLKNAVENKNVQQYLNFDNTIEEPNIIIDVRSEQSKDIARKELETIRKKLKP